MWIYKDKEFINDDPSIYGFIYKITNKLNGHVYFGRKFLTSAGYKTVNKKRKKIRKESDWKDYYGSSPSLKEDVEKFGKENFNREILHLCKSRGLCNYMETKVIFDNDAIIREDCYNSWVSCKIHRNHVKGLWKENET